MGSLELSTKCSDLEPPSEGQSALPSKEGDENQKANKPTPLEDLADNSLYILLFCRADPGPDNFHWALYLHRNAQSGGTKYHITGSEGRWLVAHETTRSVTRQFLLVCLIRVASAAIEQQELADRIIRQEDDTVNQIPGITCRIYVRRICERLKAAGLMTFPS